ncbi:VCBS repeat-containing protein [Bacteriovorax sp. PP10]|uniref:VCBS repeat-containing protein n=1 Tax=Bacteriovorax antarcticus TaxID=3088717 RepID=A0ABU5VXZ6_9BACT|nr:VCBS repeat-containing protein [Bacteriovorax sp. PP10]MEA9357934.1 VCBS repeat-containing protein [Bacteriovorax sp. PP10]
MILSISKKHSFLLALLIVLSGCADKKIRPIVDVGGPREQSIPYDINPVKASGNYAGVFVDKTEEYGLKGIQAVHMYAVDVNNDGATDLVVLDDFLASPKFYFFNKKEKKFQLGPSPFSELVRASYLNFIDLDHDGVLDVIVGNLNQKSEVTQYPARVFKGIVAGGKVSYVQKATLPTGILPTASIVPFDFNLDGEIDLYLANWFSQKDLNPKPVPDSLLQGKGFEFTNISTQLQGEYEVSRSDKGYPNATPTFGASVCDVDKNGLPDIMTNNSNGYYNKLWLNVDGKNFTNYGTITGYAADGEGTAETKGGGNSFFSLCGDYNNDGFVDIVVGNLAKDSDAETHDKSAILTGSTGTFPPKFYRTEIFPEEKTDNWSEGNRRGIWLDYNLDGRIDLLIANSGFPPSSRMLFYEQQADHEYIDRAREMGVNLMNPSGMVSIDLNGDGVMDFISGQSKVRAGDISSHVYVFENQTKRQGRGSIRFHLQGKKSNYHGISSTLTFRTTKVARFGEANYAYGSLPSQNEEGVYFAFGTETPKNVEVRWSIGNSDRLGRISPLVKTYNLQKLSGKGKHLELNLCEDGRVLPKSKKCY